jgi:polyphenol oxidase
VPADGLFTGRLGGVSAPPFDELNLGDHVGDDPGAVARNRRLLAQAAGVGRLVFMRQVHGARVVHVGPESPPDEAPGGFPEVADCDALVTDEPGTGLVVLVADCVPVLLLGERAVGVAHAGRRGVQAGVVPAAVGALRALGEDPGRVRALVGAAACGACYEVPEAMQADVAAVVPQTAVTTRAGTPGLDLTAGVTAQLNAAGVRDVTATGACTVEDPSLFSYRRDGTTGRAAGVAWLA